MSIMKKVNTLCNNSTSMNCTQLNDNNSSTYIKNIQLTKLEELSSHQYNLITNIKKLKFYSIFKNDCHKSDCLNIITNINHKKTLNKFRLGNHRLQIETGKYTVPKTPENLRICRFGHLNEVVIFTIVFDLTFTETLVIDTFFLIILTTTKKPSSYLTMSVLISTDLQLLPCIYVWNIEKNVFFNYSPYFDLRFTT